MVCDRKGTFAQCFILSVVNSVLRSAFYQHYVQLHASSTHQWDCTLSRIRTVGDRNTPYSRLQQSLANPKRLQSRPAWSSPRSTPGPCRGQSCRALPCTAQSCFLRLQLLPNFVSADAVLVPKAFPWRDWPYPFGLWSYRFRPLFFFPHFAPRDEIGLILLAWVPCSGTGRLARQQAEERVNPITVADKSHYKILNWRVIE